MVASPFIVMVLIPYIALKGGEVKWKMHNMTYQLAGAPGWVDNLKTGGHLPENADGEPSNASRHQADYLTGASGTWVTTRGQGGSEAEEQMLSVHCLSISYWLGA